MFGYALSHDELLKWADDNQLAPEKTEINRTYLTWEAIFRKLPGDCRRWARVKCEDDSIGHGVVIATNETREDMTRAKDMEMIMAVQKVVNVDTPPKWYKLES